MIKRIAVEIIKGVNFFNVTMPVEIFDTKSFLEIIGQWFSCVPAFMRDYSKTENLYD
jgi:hypothetical protein